MWIATVLGVLVVAGGVAAKGIDCLYVRGIMTLDDATQHKVLHRCVQVDETSIHLSPNNLPPSLKSGESWLRISDGADASMRINDKMLTASISEEPGPLAVLSERRRQRQNGPLQLPLSQTTGVRKMVVVRVHSQDGLAPSFSRSKLEFNYFSADDVTFSRQYSDCSEGALSFVPAALTERATGTSLSSGVVDLPVDVDLEGQTMTVEIENSLTAAFQATFEEPVSSLDHVLYCLPAGMEERWRAYTYANTYRSYYNDRQCGYLSSAMHEVGHNLGLRHSMRDANPFGDRTCMMGFYSGSELGPAMCFNGHKLWMLGWFADKAISINPIINGPWRGDLVAFVDAGKIVPNDSTKAVVLNVGDLYLVFNRAKGHNNGVLEERNRVTIVQAEEDNSLTSASILLGSLDTSADRTSTHALVFAEGAVEVVIEVCGHATNSKDVDSFDIIVRLTTQTFTCEDEMPYIPPSRAPTRRFSDNVFFARLAKPPSLRSNAFFLDDSSGTTDINPSRNALARQASIVPSRSEPSDVVVSEPPSQQPTEGPRIITLDWFIPIEDSYPPMTAVVGDTITFRWVGAHDVYIHPTGGCEQEGRIEVGLSSGAQYTFSEADVGDLVFVCDIGFHCEAGMQVTVTVQSTSNTDTISSSVFPTGQPSPMPSTTLKTLLPTTSSVPSFPTVSEMLETTRPSFGPSSIRPSFGPSSIRPSFGSSSIRPSFGPSSIPSHELSLEPTLQEDSSEPSITRSGNDASFVQSIAPTVEDSVPSSVPSGPTPSFIPSSSVVTSHSTLPSLQPSEMFSEVPSNNPTSEESNVPSSQSKLQSSGTASIHPSIIPSLSLSPSSLSPSSLLSHPSVPPSVSSASESEKPSQLPTQSTIPSFGSNPPSHGPSTSTSPSALVGAPPSQSIVPTLTDSAVSSTHPSALPTAMLSVVPSAIDVSENPSVLPSLSPHPSTTPTELMSSVPSNLPSQTGTSTTPSSLPSWVPSTSAVPSQLPTQTPSQTPSEDPTQSQVPSYQPSQAEPSFVPSDSPTALPTITDSAVPSMRVPSVSPSNPPSSSAVPSVVPTTRPSDLTPSQLPSLFNSSATPSAVPSSSTGNNNNINTATAPSSAPPATSMHLSVLLGSLMLGLLLLL